MKEKVLEYIEEAGRGELMEILEAVMYRFREVIPEEELIVMTIPKHDMEKRKEVWNQIIGFIKKYELGD